MQPHDYWQASFEHASQYGVQRSKLDFLSAAPAAAWADAVRWYADRRVCVPDHFGLLLALKLYPMRLHPVDEKGQQPSGRGFPIAEWKIDFPGPIELSGPG